MDRPTTARTAFSVAVSGPVASLLLGGISLGAAAGVETTLRWRVPVAVLAWLGDTNLLLGVFNLLPAAPLDGGRLLQAVVWWRTGDRERAQRAAGRSGQVMGMALAAVGWLVFLRGMTGGLWLMLIGLFVSTAAGAERRWAELVTSLRGVRVGQAMTTPVVTGPDWLTMGRFLSEVAAQARHSVLRLLDFDGHPSGVVRLRRLAAVPPGQRELLRARDVATPLSRPSWSWMTAGWTGFSLPTTSTNLADSCETHQLGAGPFITVSYSLGRRMHRQPCIARAGTATGRATAADEDRARQWDLSGQVRLPVRAGPHRIPPGHHRPAAVRPGTRCKA
ncbi:site-2 protease family protein [Streptomyces carpinensis]|uniref:site-2 protease family protein n=1 Tax=Streptomyces carpinensis TaxID=66369 RepID=UPI0031342E7B